MNSFDKSFFLKELDRTMEASRAWRFLYSSLHRPNVASGKENSVPSARLELNMVDTVLFDGSGCPCAWLFTTREGLVCRKHRKNVSWKALRNAIRVSVRNIGV